MARPLKTFSVDPWWWDRKPLDRLIRLLGRLFELGKELEHLKKIILRCWGGGWFDPRPIRN